MAPSAPTAAPRPLPALPPWPLRALSLQSNGGCGRMQRQELERSRRTQVVAGSEWRRRGAGGCASQGAMAGGQSPFPSCSGGNGAASRHDGGRRQGRGGPAGASESGPDSLPLPVRRLWRQLRRLEQGPQPQPQADLPRRCLLMTRSRRELEKTDEEEELSGDEEEEEEELDWSGGIWW